MSDAPVIRVRDLNISFASTRVVHDLSFDIAAGRTLALVGESGSGKSVTSLAIMGLLPDRIGRASGSITLDGRELLGLPDAQMRRVRGRRVSMIFQEPMTSLNPVQRIGDQLAEAIRIHRGLRGAALEAAVIEMLHKVRIPDPELRRRHYPHTFSGGMRQRVMIAMALACDPALIIADEPTTALDVTVQAQTLALLKDLQRDCGTAVLFITRERVPKAHTQQRGVDHTRALVAIDLHRAFAGAARPGAHRQQSVVAQVDEDLEVRLSRLARFVRGRQVSGKQRDPSQGIVRLEHEHGVLVVGDDVERPVAQYQAAGGADAQRAHELRGDHWLRLGRSRDISALPCKASNRLPG